MVLLVLLVQQLFAPVAEVWECVLNDGSVEK